MQERSVPDSAVVTHRDALHIGVLNLSFGVDFPMPYYANPLDGAAEIAWASGITVVAAAGNEGTGHVTSPGDDPYVVTAGATPRCVTAEFALAEPSPAMSPAMNVPWP